MTRVLNVKNPDGERRVKVVKSAALNGALIIISLISLFPFYLMLIMSTYTTEQLFRGINLLPGSGAAQNAGTVFRSDYLLYYLNSIFVAAFAVILTLLVSTMAGYALSKFRFRFRKAIMFIIIGIMVIPTNVSIVAFVIEMKNLGWLNTHLPLIIPAAANPFGVFWMTSCLEEGVPNEIIDSAKLDGCPQISIFFRIVAPLAKAALGTLALLAFIGSWNSFMMPMIILTKPELYTLPIGIRAFGTLRRVDIGAQIFGLSVSVTPVLIVFSVFSKNLIKGLTAGALKA